MDTSRVVQVDNGRRGHVGDGPDERPRLTGRWSGLEQQRRGGRGARGARVIGQARPLSSSRGAASQPATACDGYVCQAQQTNRGQSRLPHWHWHWHSHRATVVEVGREPLVGLVLFFSSSGARVPGVQTLHESLSSGQETARSANHGARHSPPADSDDGTPATPQRVAGAAAVPQSSILMMMMLMMMMTMITMRMV